MQTKRIKDICRTIKDIAVILFFISGISNILVLMVEKEISQWTLIVFIVSTVLLILSDYITTGRARMLLVGYKMRWLKIKLGLDPATEIKLKLQILFMPALLAFDVGKQLKKTFEIDETIKHLLDEQKRLAKEEIRTKQRKWDKSKKRISRFELECAELFSQLSEINENDRKAIEEILDSIKKVQTIEEAEEKLTQAKTLFAKTKKQFDFKKAIAEIRKRLERYTKTLDPQNKKKIEQNLGLLEEDALSDDEKMNTVNECRLLISEVENKKQQEEKTTERIQETFRTLKEIAANSSSIHRHGLIDLIRIAETLIARNERLSKIEYAVEKALKYAKAKKLYKE